MFNVVFASSNEYSPFLLIALTSLLENNKDFDCINIFILDYGINKKNKDKIFAIAEKYSCKITFIDNIFDSININLPPIELKSTVSIAAYARLFISTILPENIDKVLYLDSDALVLDSFKDLWYNDIEDYYCMGILDPLATEVMRQFWFYDVDSYVNSGVLLINLKKWREENVEEKFMEFISENNERFFWGDQGVINLVLKDKIKIVEPKYNLLFYFQFHEYDVAKMFCGIESEYYTKEIVDDARNNPVFVHFAGADYGVPWHNKDHKYAGIYKEYAEMADCTDVIHYIDAPTLKSKLLYKYDNIFVKILFKLIPSKIVVNSINNGRIESYKKFK